MKRRRHEDRMYAALAHDAHDHGPDRPYSFARERLDAENASTLRARRVGGIPVDTDNIPDKDDL